jgi:hypothetical protein
MLSRCFSLLTLIAISLSCADGLRGEPIAVLYKEGAIHGFLVVRTLDGKAIGTGELIQSVRGEMVFCRLTFRFRDGSVDDERTVYSQRGQFRLIRDHHVQKGPRFPKPSDLLIDMATGEVTSRSLDKDKIKVETVHMDLPPDLANGIALQILKNLPAGQQETKVPYLAATPKPRLVKLSIKPTGKDEFRIETATRAANRFTIRVELGGLAGVIAPVVGKPATEIALWMTPGEVPSFIKAEGPMFDEGPVWRIELTTAVWKRTR